MGKHGGYDVVTRRDGTSVIGCVCVDGQAHFFAYVDDAPRGKPACDAPLEFGRPAKNHEAMCPICAVCAQAWAAGGTLHLEKH